MADDIITLGGPERGHGQGRDADQAIESLFHACYPHLVRTGYALIGDWDAAEQLAQEAYLRLWRRWRWIADPQAAPAYLQRTMVNLSRETVRRRIAERRALGSGTAGDRAAAAPDALAAVELRRALAGLPRGGAMSDTDLERRLRALLPQASEHAVDTGRAWRSLRQSRSRAVRRRRRIGTAAVTAVAVSAALVPVLTGAWPTGSQPGRAPHPQASLEPVIGAGNLPAPYRRYDRAVVARIPVGRGEVISLAKDGQAMWAVIGFRPNSNPYFQLVRIDLRTGKVTLRTRLGQQPAVLAVADGVIWITNPAGLARRQIARIDPATGRFVGVLHLDAGPCGYLTVSLGQLWAECGSGPWNTVFLRLSPVTGQVLERLGPVRGPIGNQIAITPQGVWYYTNYSGLSGILRDGGRAHVVTAQDLRYPVGFAFTRSLVYSQGALWVLTGDESVAKVDPATGRVLRFFSYRNYDTGRQGGLDFLTAGQGSLWFLDDGYPFSGVLRVAMATGKPLGGVSIKPGACGQPCWQVYDTGGAIWVPTMGMLLRIDPGRMPG